jgi:hypothetical protein
MYQYAEAHHLTLHTLDWLRSEEVVYLGLDIMARLNHVDDLSRILDDDPSWKLGVTLAQCDALMSKGASDVNEYDGVLVTTRCDNLVKGEDIEPHG